ncbi:MAG: NAD(+)/NADH kinase [Microbacterium sp.]|nr:NAD(+)/NADH kinase [Microbacterium sp.]
MIGLVVNPVAGVGGPAGLAGSDGADVQRLALARGARSRVQERAAAALAVLAAQHPSLVVVTAAGAMGADAVRAAGLVPCVVYSAGADPACVCAGEPAAERPASAASPGPVGAEGRTDAADTSRAVCAVAAAGADLVLVVGGDGTLRDAVSGLDAASPCDPSGESPDAGRHAAETPDGRENSRQTDAAAEEDGRMPDERMPDGRMPDGPTPAVLGVPAGVKMYSPVFAVSPAAAGAIAAEWVSAGGLPTEEREVLDIDEAAMRRARVDPVLHGFLRVPVRRGRTQARKAPTPATEAAAVEAAARGAVARMRPGIRYLLGPGGTTAEVARQLDVDGTPLGVDVILDGALIRRAASEQELLAEIAAGPAQAVVTVIGGQGFLLGRGNQQLSASVLGALGDDPLLVVAPEQKIIDLHGRPLLVDTGDADLDARLAGHVRITTGVGTSSLYAVAASHTL